CSAESDEVAATILTAAAAAGLPAGADCRVGLGAPSTSWALAATRGVEALGPLGGGRFLLTDRAAELTPPEGTAPETLAEVTGRLEAALPEDFRLTAAAPQVVEPVAEAGPAPEFEATLATGGQVRLSGSVADATSQD
ncbi:hypothetical protein G3V89_23765, partial [Escherichia coli]|nr:hypothetical protein [Escherichia coli]